MLAPPSAPQTDLIITLAEIEQAAERTRGSIAYTPARHSAALSTLSGQIIFLKLDNLQRTGAFKERGALNKILSLSAEERSRGVIAASAGNHAQAVAYHAAAHGMRVRIVMPETTPLNKISKTAGYGAEVLLHGANYDEAYAEAVRLSVDTGMCFLHPFDDAAIIAGQGTLGLELLEQVPELEAVVVPIGGGGLISGVACAVKESRPGIKVIGVQTERLPSMLRACEAGGPVTLPPAATIADGIAVRRAGALTYPMVQRYVDEIVTVEEEEIAQAILLLLESEKTLAEGAGAVALAAVLQGKTSLAGSGRAHRTAVLVCGGNIDVSLLSMMIERGLVKDGRRTRLRIHLTDRPGALHGMTRILAEARVNIVETSYDRAYYGVNLGNTAIDVTLETRGVGHIAEIREALTEAGYQQEQIS